MPRNMSFSLTTEQIRKKTKTVTRRNGWWFLRPGDIVTAVEKARGLKKGEKVKRICRIRIVSVRAEPLGAVSDEDVAREGFPGKDRDWFMQTYCRLNRCGGDVVVNRIEFEYL